MRILHLAKYYWPRSGGMERVVQGLAEGAAALGHDVQVVAVESVFGTGQSGRTVSPRERASSSAERASVEAWPCPLKAGGTSVWISRITSPLRR